MIIELYGLPGSGKTTFAKRLAQEGGFVIIKIRSRSALIFYNLLFLLHYPVKFFRLLRLVISNAGSLRLFYFKLMNTFLDYNAKYMKARNHPKALLDQGHHTNVYAVFERDLDKSELLGYLRILPKPDRLIVFDLPLGRRRDRIESRSRRARSAFGEDYQDRWERSSEHNNSLFLELVKAGKQDGRIVAAGDEQVAIRDLTDNL